jgi:DNA polymerase IV (DinB-like DNA polymerase)
MFLHVDIDAFFPSAEKIRRPELKDKPVVVCMFTRNNTSGAVASASYEARKLGIKSGMPLSKAKELCSTDTVFLEADKNYYSYLSERVMNELLIFGKLEVASIDEAYIEIDNHLDHMEIAKEIKKIIKDKFGLTITVGIGKTRVLAKIASKISKPDGLLYLNSIKDVKDKDISVIPGIGKETLKYLKLNGINNVNDLLNLDPIKIKIMFPNKFGDYLNEVITDKEPEVMRNKFKEQKQKGKIITFDHDTDDKEEIKQTLYKLANDIIGNFKDTLFSSLEVILIIKNNTITKSKKIKPTASVDILNKEISNMVDEIDIKLPVRRAGVFLGGFIKAKQRSLNDFS